MADNWRMRVKKKLPLWMQQAITEFRYRFMKKTGEGDDLLRIRSFGVYHRRYDHHEEDPVVYLSFDVEWRENQYFLQMLDTLKEKKVCAYMFLIGNGIREHADIVQRIIDDGHLVGNHTMRHPNLATCTPEQVSQEMADCHQVYREVTGQEMHRVMRPPYGLIHRPLAKHLHKIGYTVMHWSLHVHDYMKVQPEWEEFETYYRANLHNGGIILQHSFSRSTAENLGKLIDLCREEGYRFAAAEEYSFFDPQ